MATTTVQRTLRAASGRLGAAAAGAGVAVVGAVALESRRRRARGQDVRLIPPDPELVRASAGRITTPLLPDDYLRLLNPLWTARETRGKVVRVIPETDDAATIVIRPGWGWSFDYMPGQYAGIGLHLNGRWHWRSYSLSSPPKKHQGHISITVKAMPEGFLSTHLVRGVTPGTIVRLALPQGDFVLPDPPPSRMLFWTGGSGITPVMAMLRSLDRRGSMPDVVHIHSARTRNDAIFVDELLALGQQHSSLKVIIRLDDEDGRFSLDQLATACPDWAARDAWVCGPGPMLDSAEAHWKRARLSDRLHLERFSAAFTTSASGGHVTFARSQREVDLDGATTILEAAEAAGITMPFGCRMGICHTCVIPLVSGRVKDLRNGAEYTENQRVQTCVTAAAGDCIIDV